MLSPNIHLKAPVFCTLLLDSKISFLTTKQWEGIIAKLKPHIKEIIIVNNDNFPQQKLIEISELINIAKIPFSLESHANWEQPQEFLDRFMRFPYLSSFRVEYPPPIENMLQNVRFTIHCGIETHMHTLLKEEIVPDIRNIVITAKSIGAKSSIFSISPNNFMSESSLKKGIRILEELEGEGYNVIFEGCLPLCFYPHHWDGCYGGTFSSVVDSNGDVRVCRYDKKVVGNLLEDTLFKIWSGKSIKRFKSSLPRQCKKCTLLEACPQGCKEILDLFMRTPFIENVPEDVIDVALDGSLYPYPQFAIREESFGAILSQKRSVLSVNHKGYKLAKIIDGSISLDEFQKKYGEDALFFLYTLYMKRFIIFSKIKVNAEKEIIESKSEVIQALSKENNILTPSFYELPITEDDKLELFYVMQGAKPVCRLMLPIQYRDKIESFCRLKSLCFFIPPSKLLVKKDPTQQNYVHRVEYAPINHESEGDFIFVYVSRDLNLLNEIMNNSSDDYINGKLLGYPSCCNNFFAQQKNIDIESNLDFTTNVPWVSEIAPFFTNVAIRCFGINIIHHFPCNLFCKESVTLGKEYLSLMSQYDSKLADTYIRELSSFVVYTKEGVFYTPFYKVEKDNLITYSELRTSNPNSKLYQKLCQFTELTVKGPNTMLLGEEVIDNKNIRLFLFGKLD